MVGVATPSVEAAAPSVRVAAPSVGGRTGSPVGGSAWICQVGGSLSNSVSVGTLAITVEFFWGFCGSGESPRVAGGGVSETPDREVDAVLELMLGVDEVVSGRSCCNRSIDVAFVWARLSSRCSTSWCCSWGAGGLGCGGCIGGCGWACVFCCCGGGGRGVFAPGGR